MLKTITLSNKCFIPIAYSKDNDQNFNLSNSNIGPIRLNPRKYSVNKIMGANNLAIDIDGKQYICSNINVLFSPGKTPIKIKADDLDEITWEGKEVTVQQDTITLEIEVKEEESSIPLTGYNLGSIKINNNIIPGVESIELFTENTILKAKMIFALDHIKFTGSNVETEINYYKKPEDAVLTKYTFKVTNPTNSDPYSELVFYANSDLKEEELNNRIGEITASGYWKLST